MPSSSQEYQIAYRAKKLAQDPEYFKKIHQKHKDKKYKEGTSLPGQSLI